ncbi:MAG: excinuclease ABC subunit UvrC [Proteobacteria bacterium]|nr:excinuclease ABC subunit UvrC [Pseudomonadota bacterium]
MAKKSAKPAFDAQPFLARLTGKPGIYRMLGADDEVLYVGKARNLKRRVSSYFQGRAQSAKTLRMLREVRDVDVTMTATETEALLLEYNLIKKFQPRFNVLLRDDKSFPYIYISTDHAFPRLSFYRGVRKGAGKYFGPYPSAHAVRETLSYLQKLFLIRPCDNSYFSNRSRPCLQYQIKRCSAPCVGLIGREAYASDLADALLFLDGKSNQVIDGLVERMDVSAAARDYEKAAHYRDQIASLKKVQERQFVYGRTGNFDAVSLASAKNTFCVSVMFIRSGRSLGSKSYFPKTAPGSSIDEVMSAFLAQYYLAREAPAEVLISSRVDDADLLAETLGKRAGRKVSIRHRVRGQRARWLEMTRSNAEHALGQRLAGNATMLAQLEAVKQQLGLAEVPQRLECFDISHTQGEATVASCVVFNQEGAAKSAYRRFNIKGLTPGDDYAAMRQAMTRRYLRVKKGEFPVPDMVIIDGGKGQLSAARKVMQELQLTDIPLLAVAKGAGRRAGREKRFLSGLSVYLSSPVTRSRL